MAYTDSEWDPIINCTLNNISHLEQLIKRLTCCSKSRVFVGIAASSL